MPEDARSRFDEDVFAHRVTKHGKVLISWQGRLVTTVAGKSASRLIERLATADRREVQHLLARHRQLQARQRARGRALSLTGHCGAVAPSGCVVHVSDGSYHNPLHDWSRCPAGIPTLRGSVAAGAAECVITRNCDLVA